MYLNYEGPLRKCQQRRCPGYQTNHTSPNQTVAQYENPVWFTTDVTKYVDKKSKGQDTMNTPGEGSGTSSRIHTLTLPSAVSIAGRSSQWHQAVQSIPGCLVVGSCGEAYVRSQANNNPLLFVAAVIGKVPRWPLVYSRCTRAGSEDAHMHSFPSCVYV